MADFARWATVLEQQPISRDPLSGILDGTNVTFHSSYFPILTSGSLGVFVGGVLTPGTADYNTGEITLVSPPVSQPFASYTFTPYNSNQVAAFTIQGFSELESRWTRGWQLLDASGNWADENSANVYVVDGNGHDPTTGATVFSRSRVQVGLLMLCCEYRFSMLHYRAAARSDFMWRESVRGMTIDKSKRPSNINLSMDDMRDQLDRALAQAQIEYYPGGENFGAAIVSPHTAFYMGAFEWQTDAIANSNWAFEGYNNGYRSLTYYP